MGPGGISIWQLIIILAIVLLVFGTKRLRGLGGDLGGAIKGFRDAMGDDKNKDKNKDPQADGEAGRLDADGDTATQQRESATTETTGRDRTS